jgi:hypothetical protein
MGRGHDQAALISPRIKESIEESKPQASYAGSLHFRFAFRAQPLQTFWTEPPSGAVWGVVMKFRDLLNNDQLILVVCYDCGGKTPVDPALPALEHGVDADVDRLRPELHCPVCGSADLELRAHSPIAHRLATTTRAAERA